MIAFLNWTFRACAVWIVLPVAVKAAAAGQYLAALLLVAVLVLVCATGARRDD